MTEIQYRRMVETDVARVAELEKICFTSPWSYNSLMGELKNDVAYYAYAGIRDEREALEKKIRALKHAVNVFNASHTVPGTDMTVDQLLIRIPQLSARKARLAAMKNMLPKTREVRYNSNLVEYRYVNYDLAAVAADYEAVSDELAKAQTALDTFNNTERFEFEI